MPRLTWTTWGIAFITLALAGTAAGQEGAAPNPRDAVLGFQAAATARDYARASGYLDLARVPASRRESVGPELARKVQVVMEPVCCSTRQR